MKKFKLAWVSEIEKEEAPLKCEHCNQDITPSEFVDGFKALKRLCSGRWDKIAYAEQEWLNEFRFLHLNEDGYLRLKRDYTMDGISNALKAKFLKEVKWFHLETEN